ncbi:MAG: YggT family protein [Acutalibacteraceae bacterium]
MNVKAGPCTRCTAKWSCNSALSIVLYIITKTVYFGIVVLQILMFLRAAFSWIMPDDDNMFSEFIYTATEPIIAPVRGFLERFDFVRGLPFDISFFVTFMILVILQNALPTVAV